MRPLLVWLHRWVGLTITILLVIVGLTGSVLAFRCELDLWLNPDLLRVTPRDAPMLDLLTLRELAEALDPRYRIDVALLSIDAGRSYEAELTPKEKVAPVPEIVEPPSVTTGFKDHPRQVYLNPYTGEKIGERRWGDVSLQRKDLISFFYRLHTTLALPDGYMGLGARILGITALFWTIDCFVSLYLTFPLRLRTGDGRSGKSWIARWKPAWLMKWRASAYRINFDVHRAFGLWTWIMLFVFAWSSVAFNLDEVYTPVMSALFGADPPGATANDTPSRPPLAEEPKLDWFSAREKGRELLGEKARMVNCVITKEFLLALSRDAGRYTMCAKTIPQDDDDRICVEFDADTGAPLSEWAPPARKRRLGDSITWWMEMLHLARVFGLPMKIFVCTMGFVVTALSATGVYIWWRKRSARWRRRVARQ